ncbi:MAG: oligosaccharide flippase family protein [Chitinophagales bacterium]|nr:oligosaccharide flippase family protein [Chitinophagales bacterium]
MKNNLLKPFFTLSTGNFLAQGINFLMMLVYSRMFLKEDFGIFGLFLTTLFILGEVINLKLDQAIIIAKDEQEMNSTFWGGILSGFIISILFYLIVLFIPVTIPKILTAFSLLFWSWNQMFNSVALKNNAYTLIAGSRILQVIISAIITIVMGKWDIEYGLIWGFMSGYLLQNLLLLFSDPMKALMQKVDWNISNSLKTHPTFATFGSASSLLNVLGKYIPTVFLKKFYGLSTVGDFSFTQRALLAPVGIITAAMSKAYYQQSAALELAQKQQEQRRLLLETAKFLCLLGIIPCVLLAALGIWLFTTFFGETWAEAGKMAAILSPMFFASFIVGPLSMLLDVKTALKWEFFFNLIQTAVKLIVLYYCCQHLSVLSVLAVWSAVNILFYIILWFKLFNLSK